MGDLEIIELYFARDERAISATSEKYGAYCHTVANNILTDDFESEECVNDTYLRTWNTIPPTRPSVFRAFLAKITRGLALDRIDKRNAAKRGGGEVAVSLDELSECVGEGDVLERLELQELGDIITAFLRGERELVRNIFIRRYFYLDSIAAIAKRFFIGEGRVKTILHRARVALGQRLMKEGICV